MQGMDCVLADKMCSLLGQQQTVEMPLQWQGTDACDGTTLWNVHTTMQLSCAVTYALVSTACCLLSHSSFAIVVHNGRLPFAKGNE
jgi:hypothetical protein